MFVHQNFPAQFKHLAPELAQQGHEVTAFYLQPGKAGKIKTKSGIKIVPYTAKRASSKTIHPWVSDFETKIIRAEACFEAAVELKKSGYYPDKIIAHHGWGESLFLDSVWPKAALGIYCEYYYRASNSDIDFDPEFRLDNQWEVCRTELKNLNNDLHFPKAQGGISPTRWQAHTFPEAFSKKITIVHDGIDTDTVRPDKTATLRLSGGEVIGKESEVITFVNRSLEPFRGFHIFMRSLPQLLKRRPNARVIVIGEAGVSYGPEPHQFGYKDRTWKDIFIEEIRSELSPEAWARIHFTGPISYQSYLRVLQVSSVHIYLSYPFVLSWSVLEAMSCACAIVGSDTEPVREAITHGQTGMLVDFFDKSALVDSIIELLEGLEFRNKVADNARQHAQVNYDLRSVCLPKQKQWVDEL